MRSYFIKNNIIRKKRAAYAQILKSISGIIGKFSNENELAISSEVVELQKLAIAEGYSKPDLIDLFRKSSFAQLQII